MIPSILLVVAIIAAIYFSKRWRTVPQAERKDFARKGVLWGAAAIVLALVAMGRAHWLMGFLAALLALAGRIAQFGQYLPMIKKLFGMQDESSQPQMPSSPEAMTRQQAADILGVDVNASKEEVRQAHKKLMQKIHPDRGGSEALAKQINAAKECLLTNA